MEIDDNLLKSFENNLLIYKIQNILNNKSYIGKCSNGLGRVMQHFRDFSNPNQEYRAKMLYRAMNKYGKQNFIWEIICFCDTITELNEKEKENIKNFNTTNRKYGYNLTAGGTGGDTWSVRTEEERATTSKKISAANRMSHKNNPKRALESAKNLGIMRKNPDKSRKNAEVSSARLKNLNKIDPRFMGARKIPIVCLETNKIYNSMKEVALELGVSHSAIVYSVKHKAKCKGFTFKKLDRVK